LRRYLSLKIFAEDDCMNTSGSLSKGASALLTWCAAFLVLGLVFTNPILICASLIPIFIYTVGISVPPPQVLEVKRVGLKQSVWVGETLEILLSGKIGRGVGVVIVNDRIPEHFHLIDGSNYGVLWKGFASKSFSFSYKMKCTKRGNYSFPEVNVESRHFMGLRAPIQDTHGGKEKISVRPKLLLMRRMKIPRDLASRLYPIGSVSKFGPLSTDFKDIREYVPTDSFKVINWKATAKFSARGKTNLLVNEYEREGKRAIWIFLDAHFNMKIGTSVENAFEYAVEAASGIAYFFLNRGFKTGMCIYNSYLGSDFYPDSGKRQFLKISRELIALEPRMVRENLREVVEENKMYLVTLSPLIFIITHVTSENVGKLVGAIERIRRYRTRRRRSNVIVVNVNPYDLLPTANNLEELVARVLDARSIGMSRRIRKMGVTVLNWNPRKHNFATMLMKGVAFR